MRRGVVLVLLSGLVLAACGGGGGSSADDQKYADALVTGLMADEDKPPDITKADTQCIADAIVEVYKADDFEKADLTLQDLRDPATELDALEGPDDQQAKTIGEGIQQCRIGDSFAAAFGAEFPLDADGKTCLGDKLDSDAPAAPFLARALLASSDADLGKKDAAVIYDLLVDCTDFGAAVMSESGLALTDAETTCVNRELEASDDFRDVMVATISGDDVSEADGAAATSQALTGCLTPQRLQEVRAAAGAG
jgi:hypothetical protein